MESALSIKNCSAEDTVCNIELRSFDLATRQDMKVALAQAHKIIGINPAENALYAEDYMGQNQECRQNKGGVVKINLSTATIQQVVPGICASGQSESPADIQKRNSLEQDLAANVSFTDAFTIGNRIFTPAALSTGTAGILIRFIKK
jgi:hypothetical protein